MSSALQAARIGDDVGHNQALKGLLLGAAAGLLIGASIVATVVTGGAAAPTIAMAVGGAMALTGGLALGGAHIGEAKCFHEVTGKITIGSFDVFIENRGAALTKGTAQCGKHNSPLKLIAQGSEIVFINNENAARNGDKIVCRGYIASGSETVLIGGPPATVLRIEWEWAFTGAKVLAIAGLIIGTGGSIGAFGILPTMGALLGGFIGAEVIGRIGADIGRDIGNVFGYPDLGERIGRVSGQFIGGIFGGKFGFKGGGYATQKFSSTKIGGKLVFKNRFAKNLFYGKEETFVLPNQKVRTYRIKGKVFEGKVKNYLLKTGEKVVEQVTVKTKSGKRTVLDLISVKDGKIQIVEVKSSSTAPLTKNQKLAFPEIAESGATVVGEGKTGFEGGVKLPPIKVKIIRPTDL